MNTVIQEMDIPADRQITIKLPLETPIGEAIVKVSIEPREKHMIQVEKVPDRGDEPPDSDALPEEKRIGESMLALAGIFANSKTFAGDSVALIREIRDEW